MKQTNANYQTNQTTLNNLTDNLATAVFNMYQGEDYWDTDDDAFSNRFNLYCYGDLVNLVYKLNLWIDYSDTKNTKYTNHRTTSQNDINSSNLGANSSDTQFIAGDANTIYSKHDLTTDSERTLFSGYNFKDLIESDLIQTEWNKFIKTYATYLLKPLFN